MVIIQFPTTHLVFHAGWPESDPIHNKRTGDIHSRACLSFFATARMETLSLGGCIIVTFHFPFVCFPISILSNAPQSTVTPVERVQFQLQQEHGTHLCDLVDARRSA